MTPHDRVAALPEISWAVFLRSRRGLNHQHVGTVRAPTPATALDRARDAYASQFDAGVSVWIAPTASITSSVDTQRGPFFAPAEDKSFRQPTYYSLPDEVQHL